MVSMSNHEVVAAWLSGTPSPFDKLSVRSTEMADDPRLNDTSIFPDPVYKDTVLRPLFDGAKAHHVQAFRAIDRAHLVMLAETGIIEPAQAAEIARALDAIDAEVDVPSLTYTGEVEDFFFLIEKELKSRLGPDLAGRLHTARSRNDIDHTLFKLGLKQRIDLLLAKAIALLDTLIAAAEREKSTLIVAYTHGQPAQPTTFGHYLAAIIEVLGRDIERLFEARGIVDLSPMGAAAITTSGFPIDRARVAELLGFSAPLQNSYSCIAAVDYITSTYGAIELMFLHLGRPIQDFQFWTSFEVGQLYVPNALVQISSIMPQKRNPVPIEHLRHLSSQTFGRARAMLEIMHNTPFTDMNDSEGETQAMGYEAFDTAFRVLALLAALVAQIRIDPARVAVNIRRSCITITELADSLVRREGLSFRQGHEIAAAVARAVVAADGDLPIDGYAPFLAAFEYATGRKPDIGATLFAELVSPEHFVAVRSRFGGPAPEPLAAALACYTRLAAAFHARLDTAARAEANAAEQLQQRFSALMGEA
jgi:argininosuccinate lyase